MDDTSYEITIGGSDQRIALADGTDREGAEREVSHYRHTLYPGERVTLWAVTRIVISEGTALPDKSN